MNRAFTRYQKLPSLDVQIVLTNLPETGDRTDCHPNVEARRSLFPLPEGEGQGEGKRAATPKLAQQIKSFRA